MSGGIDIRVAEAGNGTADLTAAINRLATAADAMAGAVDRSSDSTRRAGTAASGAAGGVGMLQQAFGRMQSSLGSLAGAFGGFLTYLSTQKVISYADSYTNLQNRLKLVSKDSADLAAKTQEVFTISQQTRTSFEDSAKVYARISQALKGMNRDTAEAGPLLRTINQAMALSGASAQTQAGAMEQFQQAMQKGVLRGEEFNSVMSGTPALALAIADGLRKPVASLKAMADQGQLTAKVVLDALAKSAPEVARAYAQMTPTIASAFTYLQNAVTNYIGQANAAGGQTNLVRTAIISLGDNINIVIPVVATLGGLLLFGQVANGVAALYGLIAGITQLTIGIGTLTVAIISNPIFAGLLVTTIAGIIAAFKLWGDKIVEMTAKIPVLGAAMAAINNLINGKKQATDDASKSESTFAQELAKVFQQLGIYTGGQGAATKATGQHTAAVQANAVALAATGTAYNAYGEKLETLQQARQRWHAMDKNLEDSMHNLERAAQAQTDQFGKMITAQTGVTDQWVSMQAALQGIILKFDTWGQSVQNLAMQFGALNTGLGLFTQKEIDANAAMSNLEKSSNSTTNAFHEQAGVVDKLASSYGAAASAAGDFFSIQSKGANTVSGQIGGGGSAVTGGITSDDKPINRFAAAGSTARVTGGGPGGGFMTITQHPAGDLYGKGYTQAEQDAYNAMIRRGQSVADAEAVLNYLHSGGKSGSGTTAATASSPTTTALSSTSAPRTTSTAASTTTASTAASTASNDNAVAPYSGPIQGGPTPGIIRNDGMNNAVQNITVNIKADTYDQFRRSQRQIGQDIGAMTAQAMPFG